MKWIKCFFVGHKIADYTDGGYEICKHCEAHEYYDGYEAEWNRGFDKWHTTIPGIYRNRKMILRNKWGSLKKWIHSDCPDCGKTSMVLGKYKSEGHENCLPF
jgi:hypothetical protein